MIINVLDYPSADSALAAAVDGDVVYFPATGGSGTYAAPVDGWTIAKSVSLVGDNAGGLGSGSDSAGGSVLVQATTYSPILRLADGARQVHIRGLQLRGVGGGPGSDLGAIHCDTSAGVAGVQDVTLDGVLISGFALHGIRMIGGIGAAGVKRITIRNCRIETSVGFGISLFRVDDVRVEGCVLAGNRAGGLKADTTSIAVYHCTLDGNAADGTSGALSLYGCSMARVDGCRFVSFDTGGNRIACLIAGGSAIVGWCYFEATSAIGRQSISISDNGTGTGPVAILSHRHKNVGTLVKLNPIGSIANITVLPQYDETATGALDIPAGFAVYGAPHVVRSSAIIGSGVALPSVPGVPTQGLQEGMLAYDTAANALKLYTGKDGQGVDQWKTVSLSP